MEVKVKQNKLAKALSQVSKVASASRGGLSILNNVLIKVKDKKVTLTATDLNMAIVDYLPTLDSKDGSITVPARLLAEFISNLPQGEITLTSKDEKLIIESGQHSSVINGVSAEDFPELPEIDEKKSVIFKMSVEDFKNGVSIVKQVTSNDTTRPVLTGVYFNTNENNLYIAATDGYRLAEQKFIDNVKSEVMAIVPASSLNEVCNSLTDDADEIEILFDENQARFRFAEIEITSNLIDGSYPDYKKLIPSGDHVEAELPKDEMIRVTKLAALFAKSTDGTINVDLDEKASIVSVYSVLNEYGENKSNIPVKTTGDAKVTLSARYLLDALNCMSDKNVKINIFNEGPVLIKNSKNTTYQHLIMPIRK